MLSVFWSFPGFLSAILFLRLTICLTSNYCHGQHGKWIHILAEIKDIMCKILTFLRLCKVLPEDDEKQQRTINGGKVLLNERLWGRDCLTATSYFRFYLTFPVQSGLLEQKCRFTVHKIQWVPAFCTPTAVVDGLTVSALLRMSVAWSAPWFGLLFWLHKYGRTGSDNP